MAKGLIDKKEIIKEEEKEKIEVIGQESESKARKWVKEKAKEDEIKKKKEEDEDLNRLDMVKKQSASYRAKLLNALHKMMLEIRLPKEYQWGVWFDGKGIILALVDKKGIRHRRAFAPSYDPKYDLHAMFRFSLWAEDIYDMCEQKLETNLWTPKQTKLNN